MKTFFKAANLQWESNGPKECEQVGTICRILYPQTLQTKSNMEQNYPYFLQNSRNLYHDEKIKHSEKKVGYIRIKHFYHDDDEDPLHIDGDIHDNDDDYL